MVGWVDPWIHDLARGGGGRLCVDSLGGFAVACGASESCGLRQSVASVMCCGNGPTGGLVLRGVLGAMSMKSAPFMAPMILGPGQQHLC